MVFGTALLPLALGSLLTRVRNVFGQLVSANTNDTPDAIDTAMSPKLASLSLETGRKSGLRHGGRSRSS
ncbi:M3 family metallopeptidase [Novosphingobium sp. PP1Y]|uniref:M3 family metallopeptidase n=1 Tax=Novosphingobium sp. PP1Y TaxID=702113 RepID=UPI0002F6B59D|nr:M3 family metallopeptidase [Novosphingobium sp. PP1Y]